MPCLAHDKRFRSSFHHIINELRKENRTPVSILQTMPRKCCTCNDNSHEKVGLITMKEDSQLIKLANLIERVNQEEQENPTLILSLYRFKNLIEDNRSSEPVKSVQTQNNFNKSAISKRNVPEKMMSASSSSDSESDVPKKPAHTDFNSSSSSNDSSSSDSEPDVPKKPAHIFFNSSSESESDVPKKSAHTDFNSSSSSDSSSSLDFEPDVPKKSAHIFFNSSSESEDITPMETSKQPVRSRRKQVLKPPKAIEHGTFLFLPYTLKEKSARKNSDPLLEVARAIQRSRFIGKGGHAASLEKQYDVRINMITSKTSEQINAALENAKQGLQNLTIRNKKESLAMEEKVDGEWVLIRSKKPQDQKTTTNFEDLLDDLTDRWEKCLNIEKRKSEETYNSGRCVRKKT